MFCACHFCGSLFSIEEKYVMSSAIQKTWRVSKTAGGFIEGVSPAGNILEAFHVQSVRYIAEEYAGGPGRHVCRVFLTQDLTVVIEGLLVGDILSLLEGARESLVEWAMQPRGPK
jgi:hypothetical protein